MLTITKNTLLNKVLRLELDFNEAQQEIDAKTNALSKAGKFSEASEHSFIIDIIKRNIESIKKQLKKL